VPRDCWDLSSSGSPSAPAALRPHWAPQILKAHGRAETCCHPVATNATRDSSMLKSRKGAAWSYLAARTRAVDLNPRTRGRPRPFVNVSCKCQSCVNNHNQSDKQQLKQFDRKIDVEI
jgi:hypothetical protein